MVNHPFTQGKFRYIKVNLCLAALFYAGGRHPWADGFAVVLRRPAPGCRCRRSGGLSLGGTWRLAYPDPGPDRLVLAGGGGSCAGGKGVWGFCLASVLVGGATGQAAPTATATLIDAQGHTLGTARFREDPGQGGVAMTIRVSGLTPGAHGMHVHGAGHCDGPDFTTAGPHFNPSGRKHGLGNPQGAHLGDMPNLVVAADGSATATVALTGTFLRAGADSLLRKGGTALVIHARPDDQLTDPAGDSGDRVACGVILADR
ncbi:MAG: superoxide dismutase family protein [Candidatus Sericytochromatia bacterium]|nr:superoxide dismutase family protein [Candidatus Sericytochromatia bacterium]